MKRSIGLLFVAVFCVSCAKGTPLNPIFPAGVSPTPLEQPAYVGIGRLQSLGEVTVAQTFGGVAFVNFVEVLQSKESTIRNNDVAGWVYAYQGVHQLSRQDGERRSVVDQGAASWVDGEVDHLNPSIENQTWYFVAYRSALQRNSSIPYPNSRILYATADLPAPPAAKKLVHLLAYITMDVGGRTSAHSHGGTEAFYVMKGKVELATNDGKRVQVAEGQGASVKPGLVMQLRVLGDVPVQIITYFVTPEGEPWQTNLQTLP